MVHVFNVQLWKIQYEIPPGPLTTVQLWKMEELQAKLLAAERRALEAEQLAELAEKDAKLKDMELSDILTRIRVYESVSYGKS